MSAGFLLNAGEGEKIWFLGTLITVKASAEDTNAGFTLIEQVAPAGFGPPLHVHRLDDEAFYVLDGEIEVVCGDSRWGVGPGGFVLLPRGVPHGFSVGRDAPVRLLQVTTPAQFERFAREMGEPAPRAELPPQGQPHFEEMARLAAKYGYDMAASPPGS